MDRYLDHFVDLHSNIVIVYVILCLYMKVWNFNIQAMVLKMRMIKLYLCAFSAICCFYVTTFEYSLFVIHYDYIDPLLLYHYSLYCDCDAFYNFQNEMNENELISESM